MKQLSLAFALVLAWVPLSRGQVSPDQAIKTFTVSDPALEISLWASEPLFENPTCMDIDHKGRVWVCDSVNYRHLLHHQPPRQPKGDRIVVLEDTTGSGKADKATTFYQSPEILAPLGIAVAKDPVGPGYKVFVCQSPDILLFEDKDGDGKADGPPRKLLSGFGGIDHDHGVHGILIGPDNKLYFSVGNEGVKGLPGKDGKVWNSNSTDCQAGTIWRCDLDGKNLELIAHNFRNEYEPCVDSFGTVFVSDNDDDGTEQTRICYVMPGGNYGYNPRGQGQTHWHEEQPGVVPKILRTYFGAPTGMCVYEGTLLAESYRGQLLHTDAGPRQMRCYHLSPSGASYDVERQDLVTSTDTWFRPSDVCVAPDGSAYIADWYDQGVGGHGIADFTRGRIYRVAPKANKPETPTVDLESKEGILAALGSPALSVRYMAMAKLRTLPPRQALEILKPAAAQKENVWLRARALWQLADLMKAGQLTSVRDQFIDEASRDQDPRFRILAIRLRNDFLADPPTNYSPEQVRALLSDPSAAVRREALLALRDVAPVIAKPLILDLAKQYEGNDRFYLEAIGIAVGIDKNRREVILADFDKQFPDWSDKVADLIWELRPPQMLPALERQLLDKATPAPRRSRIVDILIACDDPSAGKSLLKALLTDQPPEVRDAILDKLNVLLATRWPGLRQDPELTKTINSLLLQPATCVTGLALIGAAERSDDVGKVSAIASDPKAAPELRLAAIKTLGSFPSTEALGHLERLVQSKNESVQVRQAAVVGLAASREGSIWLLDLSKKKELPEDLKPDVASLLRNSPYHDLHERAIALFPQIGKLNIQRLPSIAALARRKGHVEQGRRLLFTSKDIRCISCHTIRGVGGKVGPDLTMIGKKASRENLLESIIYPSKAVADQYQNWVIETKDGLVLTGMIEEETSDHLVLRDANGKDTKLEKTKIDTRAKSPNSLMPNDIVTTMTEDQLTDLVEYLSTLTTPTLALDTWHLIGPFENGQHDAGRNQVFPPEKEINLKVSYPSKSGPVSWREAKPNETGYMDLGTILGDAGHNAVVYLYREIDSPADQEGTVLLGTEDFARLWVNNQPCHIAPVHGEPLPESESIKVKLKKGRNSLLLKLSHGNRLHGFFLAVQAEQELKKVEEK